VEYEIIHNTIKCTYLIFKLTRPVPVLAGLSLLKSQNTLRELFLDNLCVKDMAIWNSIGSILEKSSKTLSQVTLGGCMCTPLPLGSSHFSCAWLQNCKRLEQLVMTICGVFVDSVELLPKENLRYLNLGHMLLPNQIEYISQNFQNLETWILPQKGCKVTILVPKINIYLFKVILHLPKLSRITLCMESADIDDITEYINTQSGISQLQCACIGCPRKGSVSFCVDRTTFHRDQVELPSFIEKYRRDLMEDLDMDEGEFVEYFLRHVLLENNLLLVER